ncbi:MAG: hypothetical protein NC095_06485 [Muribaculum sp.]|nr:hypothetical protein [Muribaculum sp.]
MKQINKSLLIRGLLPVASCMLITSCTDDKYDLTDIDTTSRFTVNNLTVPINLSEIKIKDVINLEDNENISVINGVYAIHRDGNFKSEEFSIAPIHVVSQPINPSDINISVPDSHDELKGFDIIIPESLNSTFDISMKNVDDALVELSGFKTTDAIEVEMNFSIPQSIFANSSNSYLSGVTVKLPTGLQTTDKNYDPESGVLNISTLKFDSNGGAAYVMSAYGMDLYGKGKLENHDLMISDKIGIVSGNIHFDSYGSSNPNVFQIHTEYSVSGFDVASVSGEIDYKMDDINIDPITLSGLPDFLDSPETEIRIANPYIRLKINNPIGKYNVDGYGQINLTSNFSGGNVTEAKGDIFIIGKDGFDGYVQIPGLVDILTNDKSGGLPKSISVGLGNTVFSGIVSDFPLAHEFDRASGEYEFTAPFEFASPSLIIYETTEDGWASEDLDKVNIERINVTAMCATDLSVSVQLSVFPIDKNGNIIPVKEDSNKFQVPPFGSNDPVTLHIEGINGPIHGFDGILFRAVVRQDEATTQPIGPENMISLQNVKITVDGYYETDF